MSLTLMESAGGLTGGKLALADAGTGDVLSGKTFYAEDKTLKTGTLDMSQATATTGKVWKGQTFYAGDKDLKTGTLSLANASVSVSGSGQQYYYPNQWRYRIENGGVTKTDNTITIRAVIRQLLDTQEITGSTKTMTFTITL